MKRKDFRPIAQAMCDYCETYFSIPQAQRDALDDLDHPTYLIMANLYHAWRQESLSYPDFSPFATAQDTT